MIVFLLSYSEDRFKGGTQERRSKIKFEMIKNFFFDERSFLHEISLSIVSMGVHTKDEKHLKKLFERSLSHKCFLRSYQWLYTETMIKKNT